MFDLSGVTVLVTGASSDFGAHFAGGLANARAGGRRRTIERCGRSRQQRLALHDGRSATRHEKTMLNHGEQSGVGRQRAERLAARVE